MNPIIFPEVNVELTKPDNMTAEQCNSLPVHRTKEGQCVSCWTTSFWNRLKFLFHGKIWLIVYSSNTQPPVKLVSQKNIFKNK